MEGGDENRGENQSPIEESEDRDCNSYTVYVLFGTIYSLLILGIYLFFFDDDIHREVLDYLLGLNL